MSRSLGVTIRKNGYALLSHRLPAQSFFDAGYASFDALISDVKLSEELRQTLDQAAEHWRADPTRAAFYAQAPMAFRDRTERLDKAQKHYFQYCHAYEELLRSLYPQIVKKYHSLDAVLRFSSELWRLSVDILYEVIISVDRNSPGIKKILVHNKKEAPAIVRLIRYEPNLDLGTKPHIDKSAFTAILNSDDPTEANFVAAKWHGTPVDASLLKPIKLGAKDGFRTDAAVIVGRFLDDMGFSELQPTPHAVLPIGRDRVRHSAVGFWVVPNIFSGHMSSDVEFLGEFTVPDNILSM